ncbi:hypothetical protein C2I27_04145 [Priestia megaterium]|uniref:hypothetical protein n=1 Tax=Priestia megaterium TaxID=1404 RepID=UPI000D5107B9|nr:hypothetical protein [Priestia megaterium]PVC75084.1 hypothetical protein C2I27_04145 [Priestia megaterium]
MPVPATTGQLRTKIDDMEIGDYIQAHYDKVNVRWQFGESGGKTELPIPGVAVDETNKTHQNYFFYFVKVGKGLLIADRNWYHTVSWDSLNAWKNMQGVIMDYNRIVKASNTQSGDIVSIYNVNVNNVVWKSASSQVVIEADYIKPVTLASYFIDASSYNIDSRQSPKDWNIEYYDDTNNKWVIIDTQLGINLGYGDGSYSIKEENQVAAKKYRLNVLSSYAGSYNALSGLKFNFKENVYGTIRSLTGGVAYADLSGNKSLTDQNRGAWPTNNEWDTYIVNFPPSLIQSGKSLDDVFHISNSITLTQDTPASGVGSSTNRIARGNNVLATGLFIPYSNTVNTNGFRPVFEYIDK